MWDFKEAICGCEATEKSDIDVMVVIDEMKPNDLKEYKKSIKGDWEL